MEGDPWACAESGDVETMKQMLRRSDVSEWINKIGNNHYGSSLLHVVSSKGHLEVGKLLLSSGANIGCIDYEGSTPLHWACFHGHMEVVKLFLSSGADINCADINGVTPLQNACLSGHLEIAKHLISTGADIKSIDFLGMSSFHKACFGGHLEVAKFLLTSGADLNCTDNRGRSALNWSCAMKNIDTVTFLLSSGADMENLEEYSHMAYDKTGLQLLGKLYMEDSWRRRRCYLMFLVMTGFMPLSDHRSEDDSASVTVTGCAESIRSVLHSQDMQRVIAKFL